MATKKILGDPTGMSSDFSATLKILALSAQNPRNYLIHRYFLITAFYSAVSLDALAAAL
jgi:hypothetical protein